MNETDEAQFLQVESQATITLDQESLEELDTGDARAGGPLQDRDQDETSNREQIENQQQSIFSNPVTVNARRTKKMNWGDLKDLIFGIYVVCYAFATHGEFPVFSLVWVISQAAIYCLGCQQIFRMFFRVFMSVWGFNAIVTDSSTSDQYVYVCINVNEFWSLLPLLCMGIISVGLMICFSFSLCCLKTSEILSKFIFEIYGKYRYAQQIRQLSYSNLSAEENIECSICLDSNGKVSVQECTHKFHPQCIKRWLESHRTCPVCRKELY